MPSSDVMKLARKLFPLLVCVTLATGAPTTANKDPTPKPLQKAPEKALNSNDEIFLGNQQNKPPGMVDDVLGFPLMSTDSKSNQTQNESSQSKSSKDITTEKANQDNSRKIEHGFQSLNPVKFDYYDYLDDGGRLGDDNYGLVAADDDGDYQYDDSSTLYRKKRNLRQTNRRKRNHKSNVDDIIAGDKRTPKRAVRPKREIGMDDLVSLVEGFAERNIISDDQLPEIYNYLEEMPLKHKMNFRHPYDSRLEDEVVSAFPEDDSPMLLSKEVPEWVMGFNPSLPSFNRYSSYVPQRYVENDVSEQKEVPTTLARWDNTDQNKPEFLDQDDEDAERLFEIATLLRDVPEKGNRWK